MVGGEAVVKTIRKKLVIGEKKYSFLSELYRNESRALHKMLDIFQKVAQKWLFVTNVAQTLLQKKNVRFFLLGPSRFVLHASCIARMICPIPSGADLSTIPF